VTKPESDLADFLGKAILLHLAIKELTSELTVDICQNCPRLVLMVFSDLERQAEKIVEAMNRQTLASGCVAERPRVGVSDQPSQHAELARDHRPADGPVVFTDNHHERR